MAKAPAATASLSTFSRRTPVTSKHLEGWLIPDATESMTVQIKKMEEKVDNMERLTSIARLHTLASCQGEPRV